MHGCGSGNDLSAPPRQARQGGRRSNGGFDLGWAMAVVEQQDSRVERGQPRDSPIALISLVASPR